MSKEDLSGMIFGRWKVLRFDRRLYDKNKKQDKYSYNWICECQCEKSHHQINRREKFKKRRY